MLPSNNNIDPSNPNELLREKGFPGNPEPKVGDMPAGNSQFVVPHFDTFQGIYNTAQRSYYWTFDDALKDSRVNARVMRRDPVLMQALRARQMPTCQLSWHLLPQDETDPEQQEAASIVTRIINNIPRFQELKMGLLEALWYGRYGIQLVYRWNYDLYGRQVMHIVDHRRINGDKLCFKYSGDAGILVNGLYEGEKTFDNLGMVHWFTPIERESVIIHKHEPEDADFQEPELAGGINGYGLRGRLYWFWYQKQNILAMLMDYLQRCALGFTIYYFDAGNPNGLNEAMTYASRQAGSQAIFWPKYRDHDSGYDIKRVEPGNSGAQLLQELVTRYFDDVMRRFILGQDLSSESSGTGIGNGLSELHGRTLSSIIKYDARSMEETLTEDLVKVLYKYNCPNVPPAKFRTEIDAPNAGNVMDYAEILYNMGVPLNSAELVHIAGLSPVSKDSPVVSKLGNMQPTAVSQPPTAIPIQGTGPINASQTEGQQ